MTSPSLVLLFALTAGAAAATNSPKEGTTATAAAPDDQLDPPSDHNDVLP